MVLRGVVMTACAMCWPWKVPTGIVSRAASLLHGCHTFNISWLYNLVAHCTDFSFDWHAMHSARERGTSAAAPVPDRTFGLWSLLIFRLAIDWMTVVVANEMEHTLFLPFPPVRWQWSWWCLFCG